MWGTSEIIAVTSVASLRRCPTSPELVPHFSGIRTSIPAVTMRQSCRLATRLSSDHAELDGAGGLLAARRWHTRGSRIVYCAPNPATSLVEVLVHIEIDSDDL